MWSVTAACWGGQLRPAWLMRPGSAAAAHAAALDAAADAGVDAAAAAAHTSANVS